MARKEITQTAQVSDKKLRTRDLIYAGAFGAIYIVLMLIVVLGTSAIPILYIVAPFTVGVVCATVYKLCVLKVRKFGAALILGVLFALVSCAGNMLGMGLAVLAALLAEFVIMAGSYKSRKMYLLSFPVFNRQGESGSGKTTIANLLARFWDAQEGTVRLRGVDIRKLPMETLMAQISMVFQKVYLFEDTIKNNIAMGRPDATFEEIVEAAKKARCYDFIMRLPYGFDTITGEGGTSLSGGEAQRISIARCILKDAPIIILDEATASVDTDNEVYIQQAMSELCRNKTVLVIAHRLNTVRGADCILVLEKGRIVEQGSHDELMAKNGAYCHMIGLQERMSSWNQKSEPDV